MMATALKVGGQRWQKWRQVVYYWYTSHLAQTVLHMTLPHYVIPLLDDQQATSQQPLHQTT